MSDRHRHRHRHASRSSYSNLHNIPEEDVITGDNDHVVVIDTSNASLRNRRVEPAREVVSDEHKPFQNYMSWLDNPNDATEDRILIGLLIVACLLLAGFVFYVVREHGFTFDDHDGDIQTTPPPPPVIVEPPKVL